MPSFTVFKGSKSGAPTKSTTTKPDQLEGDQVQLKVTVSGLCGTGEYSSYVAGVGKGRKEGRSGGYMLDRKSARTTPPARVNT